MNSLIEFFIRRNLFVNLVTIGVILAGFITFSNLQREAFPNVDFDIVSISVLYLGASPLEIEKLITTPLEREIAAIEGIKKIDSSSIENRSGVIITLDPNAAKKDDALSDIRDAVDRAKVDFPDEAEEPTILEVSTGNIPVIEIALFFRKTSQTNEIWLKEYDDLTNAFLYKDTLSSHLNKFVEESTLIKKKNRTLIPSNIFDQTTIDSFLTNKLSEIIDLSLRPKLELSQKDSRFYLREIAQDLQEILEDIDDVSSINLRGFQEKEIHVELDPQKLAKYNIVPDQVMESLRARNINKPGGTIVDANKEYTIRIVQEFNNLEEIYNTYIRSNDIGTSIQLKDVAHVKYNLEEEVIREKANGNIAIILTALKKKSGDAITLVAALKDKLKKFESQLPRDITSFTMNDYSYFVERRLSVLSNNIQFGMFFVVLALLFFLGWRVALMVALGIPFSFAITLLFMGSFDISINLISMFGLIVVSGILVDDAIVVGENVYRRIEEGDSPLYAAIEGTKEVVAPVFASISTTICAFAPLMFMSGLIGKFIFYLPAVVIIALIASLIESFLILPSHLFEITKNIKKTDRKEKKKKIEFRIFRFFRKVYHPIIVWVVEHRYWMSGIIISVFIMSLFLLKLLGFVLFPKVGVEAFFIKLEAEKGISLNEMEARVRFIEDVLVSLPKKLVESFQSRIGILQEEPNDPFTKRGKNYAQMNVYLTPSQTRGKKAGEIINDLKLKLNQEKPILYSHYDSKKSKVYILSYDSVLRVYSYLKRTSSLKIVDEINLYDDYVLGGGFVQNGNFLFYTNDFRLFSKNIITGEKIEISADKPLYNDNVLYFKILPNQKMGLLVSEKGNMYFISLDDGKRVDTISYLKKVPIRSIEFSSLQEKFVVSRDGIANFYTFNKEKVSKTFQVDFIKEFNIRVLINDVSISINQKRAYFSLSNGYLAIVDIEKENLLSMHDLGENAQVTDLSWVRELMIDGQTRLALLKDKKVYIINIDSFSIIHKLDFPDVVISNVLLLGENKEHLYFLTLFRGQYALDINNISSQGIKAKVPFKKIFKKVEYISQSGGPPVGKPISIELRGDSFDVLQELSARVQNILYSTSYVFDIQDSWEDGGDEFHLVLDEEKASIAGVSVSQIANTIQMAFDGRVVTSIKETNEEINIRVLFPEHLRKNLKTLDEVRVSNKVGNLLPIRALADFKLVKGVSHVTHVDEKRILFVQANLDETKTSSLEVNTKVLQKMESMIQEYPGYTIKAGGEYEDTQESFQSLLITFLFGLVAILAILILLYGNLKDPLIILMIIPLGIVGVIISFSVHKILFLPDLSFSFMALMGVIGLTGIVVNDSIILVDRINRLRQKYGMTGFRAVIQGAKDRLRAILLTTITTVLGIFPVAYGIGGGDPFLKPMALAMGWGLVFATFITLIVVPVLYSLFHSISKNTKNS